MSAVRKQRNADQAVHQEFVTDPFGMAVRHQWTEDAPPLECEPTYSLDRQLAQWRAETSPERIRELNAEWEARP